MSARRVAGAFSALGVAAVAPVSSSAAVQIAQRPVAGLRSAPNEAGPAAVSSNWAGYAVSGAASAVSYRAVSGAWTQPTATCTAGKQTYAAFWIGLGGFSPDSQTLEQIGTSADCSAAGKAEYSVWYELVPAAAVPLRLKVSAGDSISAVVVVSGKAVTLRIRNLTRGTVFTKRLTMSAPDVSSAEWIAEAPSECAAAGRCRVLPLTNFGTVSFARAAAATLDSHAGTISDLAWAATPIELVPDASAFASVDDPAGAAVPSELTPDGSGFSVAWENSATVSG